MFNIGFGEFLLLAVLGLLVFGPDRLPEAVRHASQTVRQLRTLAQQTRDQVAAASGMDDSQTADVLSDLRDLHPKRLMNSVLNPQSEPPAGAAPVGAAASMGATSTGIDPDLA